MLSSLFSCYSDTILAQFIQLYNKPGVIFSHRQCAPQMEGGVALLLLYAAQGDREGKNLISHQSKWQTVSIFPDEVLAMSFNMSLCRQAQNKKFGSEKKNLGLKRNFGSEK